MNYLGLNKSKTEKTASALNQLLANYHVYYQNLRNFHWNIKGENFFELHEQFEELYTDAREKIDDIAERVLTLRYDPMSKMSDYLTYSDVEESELIKYDRDMVAVILDNHRIIIENMRMVMDEAEKANDEGTLDLIGGFLEDLEKASWMYDAWLTRQEKSVEQEA